jgi:hypothetical protein
MHTGVVQIPRRPRGARSRRRRRAVHSGHRLPARGCRAPQPPVRSRLRREATAYAGDPPTDLRDRRASPAQAVTLMIRDGRIEHVFYPVFPPDLPGRARTRSSSPAPGGCINSARPAEYASLQGESSSRTARLRGPHTPAVVRSVQGQIPLSTQVRKRVRLGRKESARVTVRHWRPPASRACSHAREIRKV